MDNTQTIKKEVAKTVITVSNMPQKLIALCINDEEKEELEKYPMLYPKRGDTLTTKNVQIVKFCKFTLLLIHQDGCSRWLRFSGHKIAEGDFFTFRASERSFNGSTYYVWE